MKNRIFFLIGIVLLVLVVWATTMIGISINKKHADPPSVVISLDYISPKPNIKIDF